MTGSQRPASSSSLTLDNFFVGDELDISTTSWDHTLVYDPITHTLSLGGVGRLLGGGGIGGGLVGVGAGRTGHHPAGQSGPHGRPLHIRFVSHDHISHDTGQYTHNVRFIHPTS